MVASTAAHPIVWPQDQPTPRLLDVTIMAAISIRRRYGIVLVTISAILWSTAGLFVRMAELDSWTILGWRSLFAALFLGSIVGVRAGRHPLRAIGSLGRPGLFSVPVSIVSTVAYVFALQWTTVADVMTVYATLPFIATGVGYFWLGERITQRVVIASAVSLVGISVMAGAAANARDIAGIAAAFVMTVGFGTQIVHTKRYPALDMTGVSTWAACLGAALCWPLMQAGLPNPGQLVVLALFGILTTGIAYVLVLEGSRHVTSGEAGFLSLLDVVLGPLWVWLVFAEQPGSRVLVGGGIVLTALIWYLSKSLMVGEAAALPTS